MAAISCLHTYVPAALIAIVTSLYHHHVTIKPAADWLGVECTNYYWGCIVCYKSTGALHFIADMEELDIVLRPF